MGSVLLIFLVFCVVFLVSSSCVPYVASFSGLFLFCLSDEDKQSKNNLDKLATKGTQDDDKQNKNNPEKLTT
jgi:hypothetical protein